MASKRSQTRKIKKLLLAGDLDSLRAGIHLAKSLNDADLVTELLAGTFYDADTGVVSVGRALGGTKKARHHARVATLGLISTGLGTRANELASQIHHLAMSRTYKVRSRSKSNDPNTSLDVGFIAGLPLRTLHLHGVQLDGLDSLPELVQLEVLRVPRIAPAMLATLPKLLELATSTHGSFPDLPTIQTMSMNPGDRPITLGAMPELVSLTVVFGGPLSLSHAPKLSSLNIRGVKDLQTEQPLPSVSEATLGGPIHTPEHFPNLTTVHAHGSLEGLADLPALARLSVEVRLISSLAPLRGIRLEHFTCDDRAWESLEGHPRVHSDTPRTFRRLLELRSVEGIEVLQGVEMLALGAPLESLKGIEGVRDTLRGLDLRATELLEDVSALAGFDLRAIMIGGTGLQVDDFPEDVRWAVVTNQHADFNAMAKRARADSDASSTRRTEPIDELLQRPNLDLESVNRAADLVRDANDVELVDHYLHKTSVRKEDVTPGPNVGKRRKETLALRRHFVRRVLHEAPAESTLAAKIRARIKSLELEPERGWPIDLSALPSFPKLRTLSVRGHLSPEQLKPLASCQALQDVRLQTSVADLAWLAKCKGLRRLTLFGAQLETLEHIAGASSLESLSVGGPIASLEPLRGKDRLKELSITVAPETDLSLLAELPALVDVGVFGVDGKLSLPVAVKARVVSATRTLRALSAPQLEELSFGGTEMECIDATELPSLRRLEVSCTSLERVGTLPPKLESLKIRAERSTTVDLESIASHRSLRVLELSSVTTPTFEWLKGSTLRGLSVMRTPIEDLSALRDVTTLEGLYIHFTKSDVDLRPLVGHPSLKRFVVFPPSKILDHATLPDTLRQLATRNYIELRDYTD